MGLFIAQLNLFNAKIASEAKKNNIPDENLENFEA
jgi:hypothetical protein